MSHVLLYKTGNSSIIRGVLCDFIRCKISDMDFYKSQGYVKNPKDLLENQVEAKESSTDTFDQVDTNQSGKLSTNEIRQAAKKANIDGWDKKRVKTLKTELGL